MTTKSRLALLYTLAAAPVFAAPFLAIGENAELFLTGKVQATHTDNVYNTSSDEVSDEIFSFTPGLELAFGKNSLVSGKFYAQEEFRAYSDENEQNDQLANVGFNANYDGGNFVGGANASFREASQDELAGAGTANATGILSETATSSAGVDGLLSVSEKSKVGLGLQWTRVDYTNSSGSDRDLYTVPAYYAFAIRPKLDLTAGVRYTQEKFYNSDISDSDTFYFSVGAVGDFTAKLIGSFDVGYNVRDIDDPAVGQDDSESGIGAGAGLTYLYSEKTNLDLELRRDFNSDSFGSGNENSSVSVGVRSQFTPQFSGNAGVSYTIADYFASSRGEDKTFGASIGVDYAVNQHLTLGAGYSFTDVNSDFDTVEYTKNLFSLAASLRY